MAKEKKRGFFSWLGLGRQSEEQKKEESVAEPVVDEQPTVAAEVAPVAAQEPVQLAETSTPDTVVPGEWDSEVNAEVAAEIAPVVDIAPLLDETPFEPELAAIQSVAETVEPKVIEPASAVVTEQVQSVELLAEEVVRAIEPVMDETVVEMATEQVQPQVSEPESALIEAEIVIPAETVPEVEVIQPEPAVEVVALAEPIEDAGLEEHEAVIAPVAQEQERPTKEGFFARLKRSLLKTKQNLGSGFMGLFSGKKIDDDLFEELEEQLLIADVGVETTRKIIASLTEHASRKQLKDAEALYGKLKEEMSEILAKVDKPLDVSGKKPYVILMVGVNGVGKTTTIGKLARQFQAEGKSVMLAAGDTFRAAAVEQLQVWGERNKIAVVAQHTGADSASVIFDAIQAAKARGIDVLLADTAGRLQNKAHLMEELKKIVRVMKKLDGDAPHEVMLTLDASTGQNAVSQAKLFNETVGLTGITLTKLDGTAKGGVIFAIADQFGIPIRYIGVGEGIEDLRPFKADDFIEALFARED
ncbi:signal recognition particle-docking protein FtsY [Yersinia ruckeri]|uniref:Signal recognition particle receptor FtsY n=2 Tax=Gammaproteobacteria TaxID=1236 RepID=A0A0A5FS90_YERRU|nr:signal recognition particle-docking protein FtsY [Yersinia ruckeri]AKA38540.1 cell division protein FtsY [Yersinia ruckeri]AUQ41352.1 signal recognition particle-docking protein FtsY [Yersinia ruckeri]EEP98954.1 Cell division protein ftsY [Yersinia ruckeri ATCC 29473]EKN4199530.1 signal recognition particle-docking protein FtsY [Yersinia ruckeri]EKN4206093.1 signal recognition particle-docking protein FtsY [Yersinia ruckeri]